MNEIKLFKDEAMAGKSIEEQMQMFGQMCYYLAKAVSEKEIKDAWEHMIEVSGLGCSVDCPAFYELYGTVTKYLLRRLDEEEKPGFISRIRRIVEVLKNG